MGASDQKSLQVEIESGRKKQDPSVGRFNRPLPAGHTGIFSK